jgi:two-component system, NtrC family, response regulator HydG
LEQGEILAVGSDRKELVDLRLIAATNHDLLELVQEKLFREDLYYRLNVIAFKIPPLRERPEDVLPLARHFLATEDHAQKHLSPAATRALQKYNWPGNVRELSNAIERARILAAGEVILPEHLPPTVTRGMTDAAPSSAAATESIRTLEQAERREVAKALDATGGNRTRAAELLGISRRALIYKIKKHGIRTGTVQADGL